MPVYIRLLYILVGVVLEGPIFTVFADNWLTLKIKPKKLSAWDVSMKLNPQYGWDHLSTKSKPLENSRYMGYHSWSCITPKVFISIAHGFPNKILSFM